MKARFFYINSILNQIPSNMSPKHINHQNINITPDYFFTITALKKY